MLATCSQVAAALRNWSCQVWVEMPLLGHRRIQGAGDPADAGAVGDEAEGDPLGVNPLSPVRGKEEEAALQTLDGRSRVSAGEGRVGTSLHGAEHGSLLLQSPGVWRPPDDAATATLPDRPRRPVGMRQYIAATGGNAPVMFILN